MERIALLLFLRSALGRELSKVPFRNMWFFANPTGSFFYLGYCPFAKVKTTQVYLNIFGRMGRRVSVERGHEPWLWKKNGSGDGEIGRSIIIFLWDGLEMGLWGG